jgi:hypothetical protein
MIMCFVSKNAFDERNSRRARRSRARAPSILDIDGVNDDIQQQTQRVDQDGAACDP